MLNWLRNEVKCNDLHDWLGMIHITGISPGNYYISYNSNYLIESTLFASSSWWLPCVNTLHTATATPIATATATATCVHPVMSGRSTTALVGATLLENFGVFRLQLLFCWQLLLVSGGFRRIFRVFSKVFQFSSWVAGHTASTCSWVSTSSWHALHARFLLACL